MYGRFYLPTGRLDALYSARITPTLQALVAAISDPPSNVPTKSRPRPASVSNVMISLQHDIGKWCTEYTWSAEDGMWGVRVLHNFGRLGSVVGTSEESEGAPPATSDSQVGVKRIDEEEAMEGGLKGRLSAGAEFYFSAKERSAGGQSQCAISSNSVNIFPTQCLPASGLRLFRMRHPRLFKYLRRRLCYLRLPKDHPHNRRQR